MDKESTKELLKFFMQSKSNDFLHAYLYLAYPELYLYHMGRKAGLISRKDRDTLPEKYDPGLSAMIAGAIKSMAPDMAHPTRNPYHGKVLTGELARKIITVSRPVAMIGAEQVIPYQVANDIILSHPKSIVVTACSCREMQENPCHPSDVCLFIGDPFARFIYEHHPEKSRIIDVEEALSILDLSEQAGYVHHAFFKKEMGNRFYCLCNCCSCCCLALQSWHKGFKLGLKPSGYVAVADDQTCAGCGTCVENCRFKAVTLDPETGNIRIDQAACMGCGLCVSHCPTESIRLQLDPSKGLPMDVDMDVSA
ncbi:MAG: 4Fe-4S binding protein [Deltaproteobacteria bacterium]|nr:4Fe-4S binding protein [Deltaproteobacteria bacterium]